MLCETEVRQVSYNTLCLLGSFQGDEDKPGILRSRSDQDNCEEVRCRVLLRQPEEVIVITERT